MLVPQDLADAIKDSMFMGKSTSHELISWATGVIQEIQTIAKVNGPLPGPTGIISGMSGSSMANLIVSYQASYRPPSQQLIHFCNAIVEHIQGTGRVNFTLGDISGVCSMAGQPVGDGAAANGTVVLLDGNALASLVATDVGYPYVSQPLIKFCTALVNYIMGHAVASYAPGNVTGTCPIISDGMGSNGTIV